LICSAAFEKEPLLPKIESTSLANAVRPLEVLIPSSPIALSSLGISLSARPLTKSSNTLEAPPFLSDQPSANSFADRPEICANLLSLSFPVLVTSLKLETAVLISLKVLTITPRDSSGAILSEANDAERPIISEALNPAAFATAANDRRSACDALR
jgi:hypothetical protein